MSTTELLLIVVLCGAGTFLLRLLPIWQVRRKSRGVSATGRVRAFLQGIGPAAITSLLVVSVWAMLRDSSNYGQPLAVLAAMATIFIIKARLGGIAGPTLAGALVYGSLMHLVS